MPPYMFLMMPLMLLFGMLGGEGMMGHGMMGPGMMLGTGTDRWAGLEVRYLPIADVTGAGLPAPGTVLTPTLVAGLDVRGVDASLLGIGMQGNVAVQLGTPGATGNWVTPYGGIVPRLGANLGPIRLDAGVLAGGGIMGRQVSGGSGTLLEVRPIWAVEPRLEIGMHGESMSGALVGSYLMTPYAADLGGLSLGVRLSFKSGGSAQDDPGKSPRKPGGEESDHGGHHHH